MMGGVRRLAPTALVLAMGAGSIFMWVANPVLWLWLASRLTASRQPGMGLYLLVLAGIVATMVVTGRGLGALARLHGRLTRRPATGPARAQTPWLRSLGGERRGAGGERQVLDVVMVTSVGAALLALGLWFLLFAGSSLPGA
jgi:hypothetical protein